MVVHSTLKVRKMVQEAANACPKGVFEIRGPLCSKKFSKRFILSFDVKYYTNVLVFTAQIVLNFR